MCGCVMERDVSSLTDETPGCSSVFVECGYIAPLSDMCDCCLCSMCRVVYYH